VGARDDVELRRLFNDASVFIGWTLRVRVVSVGTRRTAASKGKVWTSPVVSRHTQTRNFPKPERVTVGQ
jgi:hypothetical protein